MNTEQNFEDLKLSRSDEMNPSSIETLNNDRKDSEVNKNKSSLFQ